MQLTVDQINTLKQYGFITSTLPAEFIINELELNTVDLNKIWRYINLTEPSSNIENWLNPGPGPVPPSPHASEYLSFEVLHDGDIVWKVDKIYMETPEDPGKTISYKIDDGEWTEIKATYDGAVISVHEGEVVSFKGSNNTYVTYGELDSQIVPLVNSHFDFENDVEVNIFGNIMSLIGGDDFEDLTTLTSDNEYCFMRMFSRMVDPYASDAVKDASDLVLPATILVRQCYDNMFSGCTSLTTAPELPATTLAYSCYAAMFSMCSSLTSAPELPATTLAENCYDNIFGDCESLTTAPELPATTLAPGCYGSMFGGCTSLTTAPELPATTLARDCYSNMFYGCSSLTSAPELPVTTLASDCYNSMFGECTGLTSAPELPATTLVEGCYSNMFWGCTSLTSAPELPATTLVEDCYSGMFGECENLSSITCLATDISAEYCVDDWVDGVAAEGTFTKNPGMSDWTEGTSGIPEGWTVQDAQ